MNSLCIRVLTLYGSTVPSKKFSYMLCNADTMERVQMLTEQHAEALRKHEGVPIIRIHQPQKP
jgi:hypothetical protein